MPSVTSSDVGGNGEYASESGENAARNEYNWII